MSFDLIISSFPKMINAAFITVQLLSLSLLIGLFIGLLAAILRLNKNIFVNNCFFIKQYAVNGTKLHNFEEITIKLD